MILDNLIFHNSHTSFFNCKFCKRNSCFIGSECSGSKYLIYLFLCISCEDALCLTYTGKSFFKSFDCVNNWVILS